MSLKQVLAVSPWAERKGQTPWLIGLTTFGILALELALIRWTSSQVRVFAYFNNIVLICAFLGMGLGVALGRRYPGLVHWVLPALLLLALPLAFSVPLHLVQMRFPDHSIMLWGGEQVSNPWVFARNMLIFCSLLLVMVGVFICAGAPLGYLFPQLPVLRAYTVDLIGSLLGVVAFTIAAWQESGPAIWLALGCLPFAYLARSYLALALAAVIIGLGQYSVQGALFSPYNRIDLMKTESANGAFTRLDLLVNRDFHQYLHNLSDRQLSDQNIPEAVRKNLGEMRKLYDLPFVVNAQRGTALVVGAGTGNDVQAALRNGYREVTSVDIDGRIMAIGQQLHPEHPYAQPGVHLVVDDARAFFEKNRGEKYDVVCYGLLDSHAMASAMSTLRLDNYVYTEEGIRAAWQHVGERGHLSLAISCLAGQWFFERLYWTIARATGREPVAFLNNMHYAVTFIVPRDGVQLNPAELAVRQQVFTSMHAGQVITTSDDWPFLYVRPEVFPWGYLLVLGFLLGLAAISVRKVFGIGRGAMFDRPLFLMGAAFLLIETRGVTSLSLLFGSTWVVNSAIFSGILIMVLAANLLVQRWQLRAPENWFWALFAAGALLYFFPLAWLQTMPLFMRGLLGGLLTGLPVGFAGLIVPMLLVRSAQPVAALGSNLLGAVLGGCMEYYSMLGGLKSTALMALVLYLMAFLLLRRRKANLSAAVMAVAT
ncbi:MAG TPA: class I SAM-dependent methyltransferase [Opitutaceae bacterium]|jgi:hypothetical protein|nr:class I SAM-dependent methyltransferase [Opitutaceae bacterium]